MLLINDYTRINTCHNLSFETYPVVCWHSCLTLLQVNCIPLLFGKISINMSSLTRNFDVGGCWAHRAKLLTYGCLAVHYDTIVFKP